MRLITLAGPLVGFLTLTLAADSVSTTIELFTQDLGIQEPATEISLDRPETIDINNQGGNEDLSPAMTYSEAELPVPADLEIDVWSFYSGAWLRPLSWVGLCPHRLVLNDLKNLNGEGTTITRTATMDSHMLASHPIEFTKILRPTVWKTKMKPVTLTTTEESTSVSTKTIPTTRTETEVRTKTVTKKTAVSETTTATRTWTVTENPVTTTKTEKKTETVVAEVPVSVTMTTSVTRTMISTEYIYTKDTVSITEVEATPWDHLRTATVTDFVYKTTTTTVMPIRPTSTLPVWSRRYCGNKAYIHPIGMECELWLQFPFWVHCGQYLMWLVLALKAPSLIGQVVRLMAHLVSPRAEDNEYDVDQGGPDGPDGPPGPPGSPGGPDRPQSSGGSGGAGAPASAETRGGAPPGPSSPSGSGAALSRTGRPVNGQAGTSNTSSQQPIKKTQAPQKPGPSLQNPNHNPTNAPKVSSKIAASPIKKPQSSSTSASATKFQRPEINEDHIDKEIYGLLNNLRQKLLADEVDPKQPRAFGLELLKALENVRKEKELSDEFMIRSYSVLANAFPMLRKDAGIGERMKRVSTTIDVDTASSSSASAQPVENTTDDSTASEDKFEEDGNVGKAGSTNNTAASSESVNASSAKSESQTQTQTQVAENDIQDATKPTDTATSTTDDAAKVPSEFSSVPVSAPKQPEATPAPKPQLEQQQKPSNQPIGPSNPKFIYLRIITELDKLDPELRDLAKRVLQRETPQNPRTHSVAINGLSSLQRRLEHAERDALEKIGRNAYPRHLREVIRILKLVIGEYQAGELGGVPANGGVEDKGTEKVGSAKGDVFAQQDEGMADANSQVMDNEVESVIEPEDTTTTTADNTATTSFEPAPESLAKSESVSVPKSKTEGKKEKEGVVVAEGEKVNEGGIKE